MDQSEEWNVQMLHEITGIVVSIEGGISRHLTCSNLGYLVNPNSFHSVKERQRLYKLNITIFQGTCHLTLKTSQY